MRWVKVPSWNHLFLCLFSHPKSAIINDLLVCLPFRYKTYILHYVVIWACIKMVALECIYTRETKFMFPPSLCKLDCHRSPYLKHSDNVLVYMTNSIADLCQARSTNIQWEEKKMERGNSSLWPFTLHEVQVIFTYAVVFITLKLANPWPSIFFS